MRVQIGEKIKQLRNRDNRTQEMLANAIGVTSQAVSRWEANGGYPDMEIIPSIANYFHVTIDELFGYDGDREKRIQVRLGNALTASGFVKYGARRSMASKEHDGENMVEYNRRNADFVAALAVYEKCLPEVKDSDDRVTVIRNMRVNHCWR